MGPGGVGLILCSVSGGGRGVAEDVTCISGDCGERLYRRFAFKTGGERGMWTSGTCPVG